MPHAPPRAMWGMPLLSHYVPPHRKSLRREYGSYIKFISFASAGNLWRKEIQSLNSIPPEKNGRHFTEDVFELISLNENVWI